jgi:hypothetical protein
VSHWHIVHRKPHVVLFGLNPVFRQSTTNNRLTSSRHGICFLHMYTYMCIYIYIHICVCIYTYICTYVYRYIHIYMYIYVHSMDPLVCHKNSRMGNMSWINKYTNLQCKILQILYNKIIIINHLYTWKIHPQSKRSVYVGIFFRLFWFVPCHSWELLL